MKLLSRLISTILCLALSLGIMPVFSVNTSAETATTGLTLQNNGYQCFEAEGNVVNTKLIKYLTDSNASGSASNNYIQFYNVDENRLFFINSTDTTYPFTPDTTKKPALKFNFTLSEKKIVYIWVRTKGSYNARTYAAMIDTIDTEYSNVSHYIDDKKYVREGDFIWKKIRTATLNAGTHNLLMQPVRSANIDKVVITTDRYYIPYDKETALNEANKVFEYNFYDKTKAPEMKKAESHPRVYFTAEDIPAIKANMNKPQNKLNKEKYERYLERTTDGILSDGKANVEILEIIEARAFYYAINKDDPSVTDAQEKGYSAISSIKNYLNTVSITPGDYSGGIYMSAGEFIHKMAEVYDWCYPLLTEADKNEFHVKFYVLAGLLEQGWPPSTTSGLVSGHVSEAQVQRDMLAAGIAMYDEFPYIYENVAALVKEEMIPFREWMYQSHNHSEGPQYLSMRYDAEVASTLLFNAIGHKKIMGNDQQFVPYWYMYAQRPDGITLANGDGGHDAKSPGAFYDRNYQSIFLTANYFGDEYLKELAMKMHPDLETEYIFSNRSLSPVRFLIFNNPELDGTDIEELPLTKYFPSPYGAMVSRTSWEDGLDSNAVVAEMKVDEWYAQSHSHLDSGAFQIYYKGGLAVDSGYYQNNSGTEIDDPYKETNSDTSNTGNSYYGSVYHYNYARRTIAHNSMLIYKADETFSGYSNDGGQEYIGGVGSMADLFIDKTASKETKEVKEDYKAGKTLAHEFGPDEKEPNYTYLKGDISYAYSNKIDGFERSFMFLNLKNDEVPAAMIVFDRVSSKNASYKKSWLLHTPDEEPQRNGTQTIVTNTKNGYNGKLTLDTLLPVNPEINVVKGNVVNGTEYVSIPTSGGINDSTGYRVEVSPSANKNEDFFLNVMQVSDAFPQTQPLEVVRLDSDTHYGVKIADRVVYFGKFRDRTSDTVDFEFTGDGEYEITVADLASGTWLVYKDGGQYQRVYVKEDGGIALINGTAGSYTLAYTGEANTVLSINNWINKNISYLYDGAITSWNVDSVQPLIVNKNRVHIIDVRDNYKQSFVNNYRSGGPVIYLAGDAEDIDGVVMAPVEDLSRILCLNYDYNENTGKVTFVGYGKTLLVESEKSIATDNGEVVDLGAKTVVKNKKLYIPLKALAGHFGYTFDKDSVYPKAVRFKTFSKKKNMVKILADVSAGGKLSYDNNVMYAESGKPLSIDIIPDSGYVIDEIKFDDADIPAVNEYGGTYLLPEITETAELFVTFRTDNSVPTVNTPASKYTEAIDMSSLSSKLTSKEIAALTGKPAFLTFAKVVSNNQSYKLRDYGMLISKTDSSPVLGNSGTRKLSVKDKFTSVQSVFGLIIYGNAIKNGDSYYIRPYAEYEKDGEIITIYGETDNYEAKVTKN